MTIYHIPDPSSRLTDEHAVHLLNELDERDISPPSLRFTSISPKERSHSLLHWTKKTFNVKTTYKRDDDSSSHQLLSSVAHHERTNAPVRSSPGNYLTKKYERLRSWTMESMRSTDKRIPQQEATIYNTDEKAQQTRSVFKFAFFH
ncbi:unnamed protein product [Rotaria sp. Silwood1]|nr:unnamed protein product [Rotaria sp. Silwood1]CAF4636905.1 unnamed protein product [Rotaria sp. Silwood1]CAF5046658.1 unnamed protein product [Rotaria sp. Silwood1]